MIKKIFLIFFLLMLKNLSSQNYVPIDTLAISEKAIFKKDFETRHKLNIESVKDDFSGDLKRKMVAIYQDQFDDFVKELDKGSLYFQKENQDYLEKILLHIIASNPDLKSKKILIYFSRDTNANAYSIGDGTLVINLELLKHLETEGELAGVICHEISHYTLNHRNKSVTTYIKNLLSNETKKEEREISRLKYNKQKRAEKLIKNVVYSKKNKSRNHELEADSLGLNYLKKTKYNQINFLSLLKRLETSDEEKDSLIEADYKKYFTTKNQKFIPDWMIMEDFSQYRYSKENILKFNIDSLKTHPDCKTRIEKITILKPIDTKTDFSINAEFFKKLKNISQYELIANYYRSKEYGYCLYETLKLLKYKENDTYLLKMMSKSFTQLAKSKKEMRLNTYIPSVNPKEQTKSQQQFFNFITNISNSEMERLQKDFEELTKNL